MRGVRPLELPRPAPKPTPMLEETWNATDYAEHLSFALRHVNELMALMDNITAPAFGGQFSAAA